MGVHQNMEAAIATLVQRLETVTARLEKVEGQLQSGGAAAPAASSSSAAGAAWVGEFDNFYNEHIPNLLSISNKIGNAEVKAQVAAFDRALKGHREILNVASKCKKPDDATFGKLLEGTSKAVGEVISIRDSNRGNELWNHLSALSEGVPALGWVSVSPTPAPFVNEFKGNSEFYSNKLLREFKGKDEDQVSWVNSLKGFFTALVTYIKQYHTTGLTWKQGGEDAGKYVGAAPSAPAAAPPPGPPPPATAAPAKKGPDVNALFSEINKGTGISSGLKKVTSDMKTKNRKPEERTAVVKAAPTKAPVKKTVKKGTPKFQLEGNKWVCEFQDDNNSLVIEETEPKHTVYLYKNDNCVVNVKGNKVNSICIDSCNRCGIVFNNAIAVVEVVNCNRVEIQCQGKVPSFAIDKCSSIQVILSKDYLDTEIVTSKSDQVNILIPTEGGDLTELAVPEQYKTTIDNGKLITACVEHV